jgi:hypothetical protein
VLNSHQLQSVRDAVLDLTLRPFPSDFTHVAIAQRAQVEVGLIQAQWPDLENLVAFTLEPLATAADDLFREMPMHASPTPDQQREILSALLTAAVEFPRHHALVLRFLTSDSKAMAGRADKVAYQVGVRLLGVDYDTDPDQMLRVYVVTEILACAVASNRHDVTNPRTREALLDSMCAILNP